MLCVSGAVAAGVQGGGVDSAFTLCGACRWACVPDEEWPTDPNQRSVITSDFDLATDYGDRRQEIVFIGANMDEQAICKQLDTALLTDEEMVKYSTRYASVSPQEPKPHSLPGSSASCCPCLLKGSVCLHGRLLPLQQWAH